jgi:cysteinyl-tRNA synthetase
MSHYRSQLNFTWEAVENAQAAYTKLCRAIINLKAAAEEEGAVSSNADSSSTELPPEFVEGLSSDLNTPKAMAALMAVLKDTSRSATNRLAILLRADQVLGLRFNELKTPTTSQFPEQVKQLLDRRATARASKDWKGSDALRDELLTLGYRVKDTAKGQEIEVVTGEG